MVRNLSGGSSIIGRKEKDVLSRVVAVEVVRRDQILKKKIYIYIYTYICIFCFLGPHLQHMEVPRLGVESELRLLAYTTVTATSDARLIFDLHHSS